jgi:TPR repeat protein
MIKLTSLKLLILITLFITYSFAVRSEPIGEFNTDTIKALYGVSVEELQTSNDQNSIVALSLKHYYGGGTYRDIDEAFLVLDKAVGRRYDEYKINLILTSCLFEHYLLHNPKPSPEEIIYKVDKIVTQAQNGVPQAEFTIGDLIRVYSDRLLFVGEKDANKWYKKAAEKNYIPALVQLSKSSLLKEREQFAYSLKAADLNDSESQRVTGLGYLEGRGTIVNYQRAIQWLEKASLNGDSVAMYQLGNIYNSNKYVDKDITTAIKWHLKAAKLDLAASQNELAKIYHSGIITNNPDLIRAYSWLNIARFNGFYSEDLMTELEFKMTKGEIAKAQAFSTKCIESSFKDCTYENGF